MTERSTRTNRVPREMADTTSPAAPIGSNAHPSRTRQTVRSSPRSATLVTPRRASWSTARDPRVTSPSSASSNTTSMAIGYSLARPGPSQLRYFQPRSVAGAVSSVSSLVSAPDRGGQRSAIANPQLLQDVRDVPLHGLPREEHGRRDLRIGGAFCYKMEDFAFPCAQDGQSSFP